MNSLLEENFKYLPKIIQAARLSSGLTQVDSAKFLGLEQSSYSRIENGFQKMSVEQWFMFCGLTKISPDCVIFSGFDRLTPIGQGNQNSLLKIPKKYAESPTTTVRWNLPLISAFKQSLGEAQWSDFIEQRAMKSDVFFSIDQSLNFSFESELINFLKQRKLFSHRSFATILKNVARPEFQGRMADIYERASKPLDKIRTFVDYQRFYETDFNYRISDESRSSLTINLKSQINSKRHQIDADMHLLCRYREKYLACLGSVQTKHLQCAFEKGGHGQCSIQILAPASA